jgi:hypothetical protein
MSAGFDSLHRESDSAVFSHGHERRDGARF